MDWTAMLLTIKLALVVCVILVAVGLPIAYWVAFSKWRLKFLVESVVALPLILPPTVLGFYVLLAMGPRSPFGKLYEAATGHNLPFTFTGLVVASVLYSLPFMVQPIASSFASVDRRLIAASSVLGAAHGRGSRESRCRRTPRSHPRAPRWIQYPGGWSARRAPAGWPLTT